MASVTILEDGPAYLRFELTGVDVSFANALRRVILAETPTLAIDLVTVEENSSPLHDEFIAHRLGLIPLCYNGDLTRDFKFRRECEGPHLTEDGCAQCSVVLTLDATGEESGTTIVTSAHLLSQHPRVQPAHFASEEERKMCEPDTGITIMKLGKSQKLKCRCIATLGMGKEHAKWNPVATAAFQYLYEFTLHHERLERLSEDQKRSFVSQCQPGVFIYNEERKRVELGNTASCRNPPEIIRIANKFLTKADPEPLLSIRTIPEKYVFFVETTGAMKPMDVVKSALMRLVNKVEALQTRCTQMANGEPFDTTNAPADVVLEARSQMLES